MHLDTLGLLRCVNRMDEEIEGVCNGTLLAANTEQLYCTRCDMRYALVAHIPHLLPIGITNSDYLHDDIIQTYHEAHYSPYIQPAAAIAARLVQPQAKPLAGAPPAQAFTTPTLVTNQATMVEAMTLLAAAEDLTEIFYRTIVDICRPFVLPNMQVLDVGCGLGRITGELARLGVKQVLGMDRSPRMVEEAAHILRSHEPIPIALNLIGHAHVAGLLNVNWALDNVDFVVGDAQQIPLAASAFDLVTCLNVLDRVAQPAQMINELGRVLTPRGHLVIADPYHWDERYTPRSSWIMDMKELFHKDEWQLVREVDGIPFVIRYDSRQVAIYMDHCLIYRKTAE